MADVIVSSPNQFVNNLIWASLDDLPVELVLEVFMNLKDFDLAKVSQTSKKLFNIAADNLLWKYRLFNRFKAEIAEIQPFQRDLPWKQIYMDKDRGPWRDTLKEKLEDRGILKAAVVSSEKLAYWGRSKGFLLINDEYTKIKELFASPGMNETYAILDKRRYIILRRNIEPTQSSLHLRSGTYGACCIKVKEEILFAFSEGDNPCFPQFLSICEEFAITIMNK